MRFFLLSFFLWTTACLQTENSSSEDSAGGTPEFIAARQILVQKCAGCHPFTSNSEEEMVNQGYAVPGDPENSPIYYRLTGSAGSNGAKDMPTGGSITLNEVESIATWIESIQ